MKLGQELRNTIVNQKQLNNETYLKNIEVRAQKLFEEAKTACRRANVDNKRTIGFGEESNADVMNKVAELLRVEDVEVAVQWHEGNYSAYLHDDRASYYWLDIKW